MRITEIGEFGLIERVHQLLPEAAGDVVVGIGDDVAVLRTAGENYLLATCDVQLEGAHFLRERITPYQLGRRAAAINISDIAAMGGRPRHMLVSLGLPPDTEVTFVERLYEGLCEEAGRFEATVVGGNMAVSRQVLFVDIFLLGEVEPSCLLLRSGARPGDVLLVTGSLGTAAAGLAVTLDPDRTCDASDLAEVKAAFLTPTPRVAEGRAIAQSGGVTAMMDVSDGLAGDVGHICQASGVGVRILAERLPISPATRAVAEAAGKDPVELALYGGEDYELLFTAPPERVEELVEAVRAATGTPVTAIGEMVAPSSGRCLVHGDGRSEPLEPRSWDHFRDT